MAFLYSFIWFDVSLIEIGPGVFWGARWQGEIEEVANDPGRISYVPWTLAVVVVVFSGKTPRFEVFFRSFLYGSYCPFIQLYCILKSRLNLSLGALPWKLWPLFFFSSFFYKTKQLHSAVVLYCKTRLNSSLLYVSWTKRLWRWWCLFRENSFWICL